MGCENRINLSIDLTDEEWAYFDTCCRIRDISITRLGRELISAICKDRMVEAVLDDGGRRYPVVRGASRYCHTKAARNRRLERMQMILRNVDTNMNGESNGEEATVETELRPGE